MRFEYEVEYTITYKGRMKVTASSPQGAKVAASKRVEDDPAEYEHSATKKEHTFTVVPRPNQVGGIMPDEPTPASSVPKGETREACFERLKRMAAARKCGHGDPNEHQTCPSCLDLLLKIQDARKAGLVREGD